MKFEFSAASQSDPQVNDLRRGVETRTKSVYEIRSQIFDNPPIGGYCSERSWEIDLKNCERRQIKHGY
jgi:hypothetical protein